MLQVTRHTDYGMKKFYVSLFQSNILESQTSPIHLCSWGISLHETCKDAMQYTLHEQIEPELLYIAFQTKVVVWYQSPLFPIRF